MRVVLLKDLDLQKHDALRAVHVQEIYQRGSVLDIEPALAVSLIQRGVAVKANSDCRTISEGSNRL